MVKKKIIPFDKQQMTYVQWQDASSMSGWHTESELEKEIEEHAMICEDIGWIVYEDKKEIHLVARRITNTSCPRTSRYGDFYRIPKAWILKKKLVIGDTIKN